MKTRQEQRALPPPAKIRQQQQGLLQILPRLPVLHRILPLPVLHQILPLPVLLRIRPWLRQTPLLYK